MMDKTLWYFALGIGLVTFAKTQTNKTQNQASIIGASDDVNESSVAHFFFQYSILLFWLLKTLAKDEIHLHVNIRRNSVLLCTSITLQVT